VLEPPARGQRARGLAGLLDPAPQLGRGAARRGRHGVLPRRARVRVPGGRRRVPRQGLAGLRQHQPARARAARRRPPAPARGGATRTLSSTSTSMTTSTSTSTESTEIDTQGAPPDLLRSDQRIGQVRLAFLFAGIVQKLPPEEPSQASQRTQSTRSVVELTTEIALV